MNSGPILIVDDEPSNLATLQQILKNDYSLVFARSGVEGLAAARKHQPSLVLLDIDMPDMDGYAVCRALKASPGTENTPVIFVSSLSEVGDEAQGFDSGGVDYIVKPVSPALVRARVRNQLSLVRTSMLERYIEALEEQREKVARLSRIKTVLGNINSAMLRLREPQPLFDEACRILAQDGGFRAVWIGYQPRNTERPLPIAARGIEIERLHRLFVDLADAGASTAWIEHLFDGADPLVRNDLAQAQDPIARDALGHGFASLVALPLRPGGRMAGVLVLYAEHADFFDDEELKLLGELAGDISFAIQHIEQTDRVNYLSYYDSLTGLPNNLLFLDRLGQSLQSARHAQGQVVVALAELRRFKPLNDAYGRHVGDQVLQQVAQRLSEPRADANGEPATVARIAGDRFAISCAGSEAVGAQLARFDERITAPMRIGPHELHPLLSWGVAMHPADGDDAETLFRNAEAALKQAKDAGERFAYYSPLLNARMAEKIELESQMREALEHHQFSVHYQPKVDLERGIIVGAEALVRWQHPERGMVSPGDFIPLAEETGLIVPLGEWVIRAVCRQQAEWTSHGVGIVPVAINLSALQFRKGRVMDCIRDSLERNDLQPASIELELTETSVMRDVEHAEVLMREFRDLGLRLSLDDFGTGYSSLAYLKHFPFDTVKIDRAFVTDVIRNPEDAAIAGAIIAMAHQLKMDVVAEGVEREDQAGFLHGKGCDQIQGFLFSRAVPAEAFAAMLDGGKRMETTAMPLH